MVVISFPDITLVFLFSFCFELRVADLFLGWLVSFLSSQHTVGGV